MDYRKILMAYIRHVWSREGVDFLGGETVEGLTGEEAAALLVAAAEAKAEGYGR